MNTSEINIFIVLLCKCVSRMDASSSIYSFAFLKSSKLSVTPLSFHNSILFRVLLSMKSFIILEVLLETISHEITLSTCSMHFFIYQNNAYPKNYFLVSIYFLKNFRAPRNISSRTNTGCHDETPCV